MTSRTARWRRLTVLGVLLPLVATALLVWATSDREQALDRVPVAVVNDDVVIQDPTPMAAGRALAAALTEPAQPATAGAPQLDWTLSDSNDAKAGLRDGTYYAVLHIPDDFSAAIVSTGGDAPVQGRLRLTANAAASTTVPAISRAVASASAQSLGVQATQGYLGQVYDGFNQLAQGNQQAASGADQLADGTDQLASGASSLDQGTGQLAASLGQLAAGSGQLADGTAEVRRATAQVADGAGGLAAGARRLQAGAGGLTTGARTLADGDAGLARGARKVAAGATRSASATARAAEGARTLAREARRIRDLVCDAAVGGGRVCAALGRVARRAEAVAGISTALAGADAAVARGARSVAAGAGRSAAGSRDIAAGAASLQRGARELSDSSSRLTSGARDTAAGAARVDTSADALATGASDAAGAGNQLASGSAELSSSAGSVDDGARSLDQGLDSAAKQSPTYTKAQTSALETAVSEPVVLSSSVQHTAHGNGWLTALVLAVVLWLAALLGILGRDVTHALREGDGPVSSRRLALAQVVPVAGIGVLQGLAAAAALALMDVTAASTVPLVLLTVLAGACFTVLGLALRWALGPAGIAAFVALLLVQAAALGNVVPLETAPAVLRTLNGLLPLPTYVDAASQLVSGGSVGSTLGAVTVLVGWTAAGVLGAVSALRRRRSSGRAGLPALAAMVGLAGDPGRARSG